MRMYSNGNSVLAAAASSVWRWLSWLGGLEEQRLVSRNSAGEVRVADFDALLDAWREAYDFSKHHIVRGISRHDRVSSSWQSFPTS